MAARLVMHDMYAIGIRLTQVMMVMPLQRSGSMHDAEQRTRKALQDHMEFDAEKVADTDYM